MKRFVALLVCLACAGTLAAENAVIALANGEAHWLYYSVDPAFSAPPVSSDTVAALDRTKFSALPPGASLRLEGLSPGAHTIIGFWVTDKAASFGAFRLDVRLEAGQVKTLTLKKTQAVASLESGPQTAAAVKDTLPDTPIVIDNDYADWAPYPAIAVFPPSAAPLQASVQTKEGSRNLPVRNASSWGRAGTQLLTVKALRRAEALYFYASASCPYGPGLSIFLYFFGDRNTTERNLYTIEIPVADESGGGRVLLWRRGVNEPAAVGEFRTAGSSLEAGIDFAKLPDALRGDRFDRYSIDLKTAFFDAARSLHEEFYFTTIDCREIYR